MINKLFYIKHSNNLVKYCIRTKTGTIPKVKELEEKLQVMNAWKIYKHKTLIDAYKFKEKTN